MKPLIPIGTKVTLTRNCRLAVESDLIMNSTDGTHSSVKRDILLDAIDDKKLFVHSYDTFYEDSKKHGGYILGVKHGKRNYLLPCVLYRKDIVVKK